MNSILFHVAQMAISRAKQPLDHPLMQDFVLALPEINALADHSPGFVWRLQTSYGDATGIRGFEDPMILLNMSLWRSVDELHNFVYRSAHVELFRDRRRWFEPIENPAVLWWVPAGHLPTVIEGRDRLELLQAKGPTPEAFDFKHRFPPPDGPAPGGLAAAQSSERT